MQGLECRGHWFQGPGAPLGSWEDCSGGRSLSPTLVLPPPLPTRRSWEAGAARLTLSSRPWQSPGPPSPARAGTSKRPPRDPVAEGAGGLEEVLRRAPFHPGWEPTPGRPIWALASPCRPGEGGRGAELCDLAHATACLWASASPAARLPVSQAGAGLKERSLGRLALPAVETTRNHSNCPHTADPGAGPM